MATSYIPTTAEIINRYVNSCVRQLRRYKKVNTFDKIAFRGMSGAVVAPSVAVKLNKDLVIVRKEKNSHSRYIVESMTVKDYIIIDDFIESGLTIKTIKNNVLEDNSKANLIGIMLYNESSEEALRKIASELNVWIISKAYNNKYLLFSGA